MLTRFALCIVAIIVSSASDNASAQVAVPSVIFGAKSVLPLHEGGAAGSEKWDCAETVVEGRSGPHLRNVVQPSLLYFPAANPVATAMNVAQGFVSKGGGADRFMDRVVEWIQDNGWLQ